MKSACNSSSYLGHRNLGREEECRFGNKQHSCETDRPKNDIHTTQLILQTYETEEGRENWSCEL